MTTTHLTLEARSWSPLRDDGRQVVKETAARLASAFEEASQAVPHVPRRIVERMIARATLLSQ